MGCWARPLPGRPAGVTAFVHLPAGDAISPGPIAGTSGAVKRASWAMHGVAEELIVAVGVWQPVNVEAMPTAENVAIRERYFAFIVFRITGLIDLFQRNQKIIFRRRLFFSMVFVDRTDAFR